MSATYRLGLILVPVDGSDFSRFAAQHAVALALAHRAALLFVHVIDGQIVSALAEHEGHREATVRERLHDNARVYLDEAARLAGTAGVPYREHIEQGDPATVIADLAAQENVDLIVMGRIGRRGVRRILIGSITQRVIECSDRSVLVVSHSPRDDAAPASDCDASPAERTDAP
jgi:nucleotide-binding universal stress UspA family protein